MGLQKGFQHVYFKHLDPTPAAKVRTKNQRHSPVRSREVEKKFAGKATGSWTVDQPDGRIWHLSLIWGSVIIIDA